MGDKRDGFMKLEICESGFFAISSFYEETVTNRVSFF